MENQRERLLVHLGRHEAPPSIIPYGLLTGGSSAPPCAQYVDKDSKEFYSLAADQVTIPKRKGSYDLVLSTEGILKFRELSCRAINGPFTDTIQQYYLATDNSGPWFADKSSPHYVHGSGGCLNSWNNVRITGWRYLNGIKTPISTSCVLFYTDTWCYTKSGSFYKLGEQVKEDIVWKVGVEWEERQNQKESNVQNE